MEKTKLKKKESHYANEMPDSPETMSITNHIRSNTRNEMIRTYLNVFKSESKRLKMFSLIFLIFAQSIACYMIVISIISYFKFEVITTSRSLYETPAPFPKITICNYNQFQTREAVEFLEKINKELAPNIILFDSNHHQSQNNMSYKEKRDLIDKIFNIGLARMNTDLDDEQKKKMSHNLND